MGFYSFIVVAPEELPFPEYMVILDRGRNVFNSVVNDLDQFKASMEGHGVKILQVNRLDKFEPNEPIERDPFVDDDTPTLLSG